MIALFGSQIQILEAVGTSSSLMGKTKLNEIDFEDEIEAAVNEQDHKPDGAQRGSGVAGKVVRIILTCIVGYFLFKFLL
ncbi:hypothetical protein OAS14_05490 [Alphaproteobacteria bacterium]|nr:hypothetical protein [Alphaproteobacteria bacterium]